MAFTFGARALLCRPFAWPQGRTEVNYDGRRFRVVRTARNGEVGDETIFEYHQTGSIVWGEYAGGEVRRGALLACLEDGGRLRMVYHHINTAGELRTGECVSVPEHRNDGIVRLHETWRWTNGDGSTGTSTVEEIRHGQANQ
ncbi:MAG: n-acetylglutamate synthase [Candidatus Eremiobacteraeota bacterium]|nr:n-acetylglutamate synthase [Candidatus Eremiobacteraeota bacterium]